MEIQPLSIEEIKSKLNRLRQNPLTQRKFPPQLWESIIQLTQIYPLNDICRQLDINPIYLKRKIEQTKETSLEFREVTFAAPSSSPGLVTIELSSTIGLKATIQGPSSCLDCLYRLFRG